MFNRGPKWTAGDLESVGLRVCTSVGLRVMAVQKTTNMLSENNTHDENKKVLVALKRDVNCAVYSFKQ